MRKIVTFCSKSRVCFARIELVFLNVTYFAKNKRHTTQKYLLCVKISVFELKYFYRYNLSHFTIKIALLARIDHFSSLKITKFAKINCCFFFA